MPVLYAARIRFFAVAQNDKSLGVARFKHTRVYLLSIQIIINSECLRSSIKDIQKGDKNMFETS
jgi:hypothetical protein